MNFRHRLLITSSTMSALNPALRQLSMNAVALARKAASDGAPKVMADMSLV